MTQIISFFSPKTAGASSVSLNAALLVSAHYPDKSVAYIEVAGWSSQRSSLAATHQSTWSDLLAFHRTDEWLPNLLNRGKFSLGVDVFFSPIASAYPDFEKDLSADWLKLLSQKYEVVVLDINNAAPGPWQEFYLSQSDRVVGVVTPDPVSITAWKDWSANFAKPEKISWMMNQVARFDQKKLQVKFTHSNYKFIGTLRSEPLKFWYQIYQSFPVAWQKKSKFKKDLNILLPQIFQR